MFTRRDLLVSAIGGAAAGAVAAPAGFQICAPAVVRSLSVLEDNVGGWLVPAMFGARGDGADDTAAFHDMGRSAARQKRPIFVSDAPTRYCIGPWTLPAEKGLRIHGSSGWTSAIVPITGSQPYVISVPQESVGCTLDNLYIFDAERPPLDRCAMALVSDCAQGLRVRGVRVNGAKTGIWFREGGYLRAVDVYVARASDRYFAFGGGSRNRQLAQGWFYELTCDSGLRDGDEDASVGVAFDVDSGSAFLHFMSPVAAGQKVGFHLHDSRGLGLRSRPDGIFTWDANVDWVKSESFLVESAGRVLVHGGNFRSLRSFAARLSGFGSVEWASTNAYASNKGGVQICGQFNDFYFKGGSRLIGNGWTSRGGSVGLHIKSGSGRVHLDGGVIGNGRPDATPGTSYYALGTTSSQDYGLIVEREFSGELLIIGTLFDNNTVSPFQGLVLDGKLRPGTHIRSVDAFRTDSYGLVRGARPDSADGSIFITHQLPLPPSWYRIEALEKNISVVVTRVDQQRIEFYLRTSTGQPAMTGEYDLRWEARL